MQLLLATQQLHFFDKTTCVLLDLDSSNFPQSHDLCHVNMKSKYLKRLSESEEEMRGLWGLNMIRIYFIPKELKTYLQILLVTQDMYFVVCLR